MNAEDYHFFVGRIMVLMDWAVDLKWRQSFEERRSKAWYAFEDRIRRNDAKIEAAIASLEELMGEDQ